MRVQLHVRTTHTPHTPHTTHTHHTHHTPHHTTPPHHRTPQHSTTQHNTAQHSTTQHNTQHTQHTHNTHRWWLRWRRWWLRWWLRWLRWWLRWPRWLRWWLRGASVVASRASLVELLEWMKRRAAEPKRDAERVNGLAHSDELSLQFDGALTVTMMMASMAATMVAPDASMVASMALLVALLASMASMVASLDRLRLMIEPKSGEERADGLTHKIRGDRADGWTDKICEERADGWTCRIVVEQITTHWYCPSVAVKEKWKMTVPRLDWTMTLRNRATEVRTVTAVSAWWALLVQLVRNAPLETEECVAPMASED